MLKSLMIHRLTIEMEKLDIEDLKLVAVVIYEMLRFQEGRQGKHQHSTTSADTQQ